MMGGELMADDGEGRISSQPEYMLTTVDNPFNPFTQWDEWYVWDMKAGYHTPGLLARLSNMADDLSDLDRYVILQQAIDDIVQENISGVHKKIKRGDLVTVGDE